jgi:hypothetical protein
MPRLPLDREAQALRRTKRLLHGWDWLLFMAMIFSGFAFGRIVSDTSRDVSPVNFIVVATIADAVSNPGAALNAECRYGQPIRFGAESRRRSR